MSLLPADLSKYSFYTYRKEIFARIANSELEDYLKIDKDAVKRNSITNYAKKELKNDNHYQYSNLNNEYSKYIYINSINKIINEFKLNLDVNSEKYNVKSIIETLIKYSFAKHLVALSSIYYIPDNKKYKRWSFTDASNIYFEFKVNREQLFSDARKKLIKIYQKEIDNLHLN